MIPAANNLEVLRQRLGANRLSLSVTAEGTAIVRIMWKEGDFDSESNNMIALRDLFRLNGKDFNNAFVRDAIEARREFLGSEKARN
jgi:hypothetical protein